METEDKWIYGTRLIAEAAGVSESTIRRWRKKPEGGFLQVSSMSNAGGGLGKALYTYVSSLQHLKDVITARTSETRSEVAKKRWKIR